jgi:hypothetical protein
LVKKSSVTFDEDIMKKADEYTNIPDGKFIWFQDFQPHFKYLVMDPINKFPLKMDDMLIGFVFMSCCIDYLSGFWWGENRDIGMTRQAYVGFINEYFLPRGRYNAKGIYDSLRNGLVHLFTIKNKMYELTFDEPQRHLTVSHNGLIILNAGSFRNDLINATNCYFKDVKTNPRLLDKAFQRYERDGFVRWID